MFYSLIALATILMTLVKHLQIITLWCPRERNPGLTLVRSLAFARQPFRNPDECLKFIQFLQMFSFPVFCNFATCFESLWAICWAILLADQYDVVVSCSLLIGQWICSSQIVKAIQNSINVQVLYLPLRVNANFLVMLE